MQNYFYDLHDQLVKVEIFKKDGSKETWAYHYDSLGRRIGKGRLKENGGAETLSDGLKDHACLKAENSKDIIDSEITFLWDGSHLLQEQNSDGLYTYIYTNQDSYERWRKSVIGRMQKARLNNKPAISTATKSVFRAR